MLTAALLLMGAMLIALALADWPLRPWPLSPAVIYLTVGWVAGALWGAPNTDLLVQQAAPLAFISELAVLVSLFAVGLRLRVPPTLRVWRVALLLAGPGMVVTIALATVAAHQVLGLPWPAALLLASVVAPTDPVLASDVQIESSQDRDVVRLSLTAEGGLNDGSALPGVMLGLGLLGLHRLGDFGLRWWWADFVWPIGGGALLGAAIGWLLGQALHWRLTHGDTVARDELVYVGAVALSYGLARAVHASSFVVAFAAGVMLLLPLRRLAVESGTGSAGGSNAEALKERLHGFGARIERLIEAGLVLAVGGALSGVGAGWADVGFALLLVGAVRPASVLAVVRRRAMPPSQRRLVGWFGIRGIGSLFYLLFVLEHGLPRDLAQTLVTATLTCVAVSIVLHGMSATPLMTAYKRRRSRLPRP
ncbi:MAG: cation:proton antiporter [Rhizobacter sp.]